jgi:hypothetical protein
LHRGGRGFRFRRRVFTLPLFRFFFAFYALFAEFFERFVFARGAQFWSLPIVRQCNGGIWKTISVPTATAASVASKPSHTGGGSPLNPRETGVATSPSG